MTHFVDCADLGSECIQWYDVLECTLFRDQRLDAVLPQIGCGTTSKRTRLGCGKDAPSFAAVNSGRVRILNRPFVSNVSCLGSIRLEDNTCHRATIPWSFGFDNRVLSITCITML